MSHITKIDLEIKDLSCLETAAEMLNLDFNRDAKTHLYYAGNRGKCDHSISVRGKKDAYEIGVVANTDGSYKLNWDDYAGGRGLVDVVGQGASRLKQEYAVAVAEKQARRQGYRVKRENIGGKIRLRMTM